MLESSDILRDDYKPHLYKIEKVELDLKIDDTITYVKALLSMSYQKGSPSQMDLILNGEDLEIIRLELKHANQDRFFILDDSSYKYDGKTLILNGLKLPSNVEDCFFIKSLVKICPEKNTKLSGLYKSGSIICTQCEAEGFRRITFYIDRPDNMAIFTTTLRADKLKFPVLLSNGDKISSPEISQDFESEQICQTGSGSLQVITYHDPWPKPSYLFAIVAGNLSQIRDTFVTCTAIQVQLNIWCEPKHREKLTWAMQCLKKAMKWDEEAFGRVFDLSTYHLVAVPHFNMGAMENKGLNIFNSSCLLASKDTATDNDYENCLACIAHEYFHNWSGNRVTCRDWFQLVVKEGLTTYREQKFMESTMSAATTRIAQVNVIKSMQFLEDASPLAHSVIPKSYNKIDNMYTLTVYRKGPEVIRLYHSLLGEGGFRKGLDLYFSRHDGEGVTYIQFHKAMEDANRKSLDALEKWFTQIGTPVLHVVSESYDAKEKIYRLKLRQSCPRDQACLPLRIPVQIGLIGEDSKTDLLHENYLFDMTQVEQTCLITGISEYPVSSILRGFSAPVQLVRSEFSVKQLGFLMRYDSDPVNKWESAQKLYSMIITNIFHQIGANLSKAIDITLENLTLSEQTIAALQVVLESFDYLLMDVATTPCDYKFIAQILTLPNEQSLIKELAPCYPVLICAAKELLRSWISSKKQNLLMKSYDVLSAKLSGKPYSVKADDIGLRILRNRVLGYLHDQSTTGLLIEHYQRADNLTDRFAAMTLLADYPHNGQVQDIFKKYLEHAVMQGDSELLQKWFQAQAGANHPQVLASVQSLLDSPYFDQTNPNHVRSLLVVFSRNLRYFHDENGSGYRFMCQMIQKFDPVNPQSAASLAETFMISASLDEKLKQLICSSLKALDQFALSPQAKEIVSKIVAQ